jgi:hypothetical protein
MLERMNRRAWGLAAAMTVVACCAMLLLFVSKPEKFGFVPGSVKLRHAHLDGERAIVIDGNSPNFLGQVQGIGHHSNGTQIYLEGFVVHFHPLSAVLTHTDWPVVFLEKDMAPGHYQVFYWASGRGYLPAGGFTIARPTAGLPTSFQPGGV